MTQQELFEAWAAKNGFAINTKPQGNYASAYTVAAWLAWQAACPEGWQAVPVEQTRHMAYAVEDTSLPHFCTSSRQSRHHEIGREIYAANLAAAPKPEDV
ncbi:hypothetical protein Q8G38_09080 [Halomonas venusta]|uniref:hypothetical protein n=1 Tax=Vreelandella venusta TaxID=44935 RepID=UPI00295E5853|nr:hypothetical protein [Halomonas venusta]MDW0359471.1 hypothetical protein [Halomonas venusta]